MSGELRPSQLRLGRLTSRNCIYVLLYVVCHPESDVSEPRFLCVSSPSIRAPSSPKLTSSRSSCFCDLLEAFDSAMAGLGPPRLCVLATGLGIADLPGFPVPAPPVQVSPNIKIPFPLLYPSNAPCTAATSSSCFVL